jgi:hypothetical protein
MAALPTRTVIDRLRSNNSAMAMPYDAAVV